MKNKDQRTQIVAGCARRSKTGRKSAFICVHLRPITARTTPATRATSACVMAVPEGRHSPSRKSASATATPTTSQSAHTAKKQRSRRRPAVNSLACHRDAPAPSARSALRRAGWCDRAEQYNSSARSAPSPAAAAPMRIHPPPNPSTLLRTGSGEQGDAPTVTVARPA